MFDMKNNNPSQKDLVDHTLEIQVNDDSMTFTNFGSNPIKNINITGREMYHHFGFSAFGLDDTHAPPSICEGKPIYIELLPADSKKNIKSTMWFGLEKYRGPKQFLIDATFTVIGQTWPSSSRFVPVTVNNGSEFP
jgi:hypothetical protein